MATIREERVTVPRREMKFLRLDGRSVDVEVIAVPVTFQGQPASQFMVHDITDRKQAERNLAESEEKFRILADESLDSIVIHDGVRMISVNQTFCRTCGYRPEEVIGSEVARYVTPESMSLIRTSHGDRLRQDVRDYGRAQGRDGIPDEVAGKRPTYNGQTVYIATLRDVSAARRAEEALRASEERFRGVFQHAPLGIAIGTDGIVTAVNPAFAKIVGYEAEELVGRKVHKYTHPDDYARELTFVQDILSDRRKGATMQKRFLHKDGHVVWANVTMTAMRNRRGDVEGVIRIVEDITESKHAEQWLRVQHNLSIDLGSIRELQPALQRLLEAIGDLSEIDCCGLYLVDPATGELNLAIHRGLSAQFVRRVSHYAADSPNARMAQAGKPIYGHFSGIRPPTDADLDREGLRAVAALPIAHNGRVIAILNLASHTQDELSAQVKTTLEIIAAETSGTIARIRASRRCGRAKRCSAPLPPSRPPPSPSCAATSSMTASSTSIRPGKS